MTGYCCMWRYNWMSSDRVKIVNAGKYARLTSSCMYGDSNYSAYTLPGWQNGNMQNYLRVSFFKSASISLILLVTTDSR